MVIIYPAVPRGCESLLPQILRKDNQTVIMVDNNSSVCNMLYAGINRWGSEYENKGFEQMSPGTLGKKCVL